MHNTMQTLFAVLRKLKLVLCKLTNQLKTPFFCKRATSYLFLPCSFQALDYKNQYNNLKIEYDNRVYEISVYKNEIEKLKTEINKKDSNINLLSNELNHIKTSHTYRFWKPYFKIRDFMFPKNSKRRLFAKLIFSGIRHPIWFIRHLTPTNIKKFGKYYNSEGADRVYERIKIYKSNNIEMKKSR